MEPLIVEQWPLDRLKPYARNPRKHDSVLAQRMVASIKEYGFRIPVVARSKDGLLICGHLRLLAAQQMGLTTVPVALADNLSEAQIKAFRLLDNRSANWAECDADLLKVEIAAIKGDGLRSPPRTGQASTTQEGQGGHGRE
jgi:ParB-like chromosome segregation protein Spo0J